MLSKSREGASSPAVLCRVVACAAWAIVAAVLACSSGPAAAVRVEHPDFAGVRYPGPQPPASPGPLPPPPVAADEGVVILPAPSPPDLPPRDEVLSDAVQNAAVRDLETERLARGYFALVEALYRTSAASRPVASGDPDTYDPLPIWRLHAHLGAELGDLTRRAAALQGRYLDIAQDESIDLQGDPEGHGRPGRVRFYFRMCSCIRRDAEERASHGSAYLRAHQEGLADEDLRLVGSTSQRYLADMQMLARTVECSRLVARSLQGN